MKETTESEDDLIESNSQSQGNSVVHKKLGYYYYKHISDSAKGAQDSTLAPVRDWNAEFREMMAREDSMEKFVELSQLVQDFNYVAETYGRIIILERYSQIKTILPVDIGGVAGGEKYLAQGILFKFAVDSNLLYGGDDHSATAAGNELKGLIACYRANIPGIHLPLMSLIDFRGFRLIAQSILPLRASNPLASISISAPQNSAAPQNFESTIIYGSSDAGKAVYAKNPEFNDKMKQLAGKLFLKGHWAGLRSEKEFIFGPTDIEGHLGEDGRYYLLDFGRLSPPADPACSNSPKRSVLYNLLRFEFLAKLAKRWEQCQSGDKENQDNRQRTDSVIGPLSSDSLSGFGVIDKQECDLECRQASKVLISDVIPSFVEMLEGKNPSSSLSGLSGARLCELAHREGANLRHFGVVRKHSKSRSFRSILLHEMIARTSKNSLRVEMRRLMQRYRQPSETPYKQMIVKYCNTLLGRTDESQQFWLIDVKTCLIRKYGEDSLSGDEKSETYDLGQSLSFPPLIERIACLTGIKFKSKAIENLRESHRRNRRRKSLSPAKGPPKPHAMNPPTSTTKVLRPKVQSQVVSQEINLDEESRFQFVYPDVRKISVLVKDMNVSTHAEGMALFHQSQSSSGEEGERLFNLAIKKFQTAGSGVSSFDDRTTVEAWGEALHTRGIQKKGKYRDQLVKMALDKYSSIGDEKAILRLADALYDQSQKENAVERGRLLQLSSIAFESASKVIENSSSPAFMRCIEKMADILCCLARSRNSPQSSDFLEQAGKKYRLSLPVSSPTLPNGLSGDLGLSKMSSLSFSKMSHKDFACCVTIWKHCPTFSEANSSWSIHINDAVLFELSECLQSITLSSDGTLTPVSGKCFKKGNSFPNLKSITWSENGVVSDDVVEMIASSCPTLEQMNISGCPLITKPIFPNLISLTFLDMSDCPQLRDGALESLASTCPNLTNINLSQCMSISAEGVSSLIIGCHKLSVLDVSGCKQLRDSAITFATKQLKLTSLSATGLTLRRDCVSLVFTKFQLTQVKLAGSPLFDEHLFLLAKHSGPLLTELDITRCKSVTDAGVIRLANRSPNLKSISLGSCTQIGDPGVNALAVGCPDLSLIELAGLFKVSGDGIANLSHHCSKLTSIMLQQCDRISEKAVVELTQKTQLTSLNLYGWSTFPDTALSKVAQNSPSLEKLFLGNCKLVSNASIANIGLHCTHLQVLSLTWCTRWSSNTFEKTLQQGKIPNLRHVDVRNCKQLGDTFLNALANHCPRLEKLWVDNCHKITDVSLLRLTRSCSMKSLRLGGLFKLTDAAISSVAINSPHLLHFNLARNYRITDSSVIKISRHCRSIQSLNLSGCTTITDSSLAHLVHCPSLRKLVLDSCSLITKEAVDDFSQRLPQTEVSNKLVRNNTRDDLKMKGWNA